MPPALHLILLCLLCVSHYLQFNSHRISSNNSKIERLMQVTFRSSTVEVFRVRVDDNFCRVLNDRVLPHHHLQPLINITVLSFRWPLASTIHQPSRPNHTLLLPVSMVVKWSKQVNVVLCFCLFKCLYK